MSRRPLPLLLIAALSGASVWAGAAEPQRPPTERSSRASRAAQPSASAAAPRRRATGAGRVTAPARARGASPASSAAANGAGGAGDVAPDDASTEPPAPSAAAAPPAPSTSAAAGARKPLARAAKPAAHKPEPRKPEPRKPPTPPAQVAGKGAGSGKTGSGTAPPPRLPADPELAALLAADRALFPEPVPGLRVGWSWPGTPVVDGSGLPPSVRVEPRSGASGTEEPRRVPDPPIPAVELRWANQLSAPDFQARLSPRVVRYLVYFRDDSGGRALVRAWAKKAGRYLPSMQAEFARRKLPVDLVWLSMVESGHVNKARSGAGAAGLWQFMPDSARAFGLTVDRWLDERLDPRRSTDAAARLLADLQRRFGSWELAMAAYNFGHGGVQRAVLRYNASDFHELCQLEGSLPWETTLYVPKIVALAYVMRNRAAFGVDDAEPVAAERFELVEAPPATSLAKLAEAAEQPLAVFTEANPQLLADRTPPAVPGETRAPLFVRVPEGRGPAMRTRLATARAAEHAKVHVARLGENLRALAERYRTSRSELRRLNALSEEDRLVPGTVLLVPSGHDGEARPEPVVVAVPPRRFSYADRRRVFFEVSAGDTLQELATALELDVGELTAWNAVDPRAALHSGMFLQLFLPAGARTERVRLIEEQDARVVVPGTSAFFEATETDGRRRLAHVVKAGDSWQSIGNKYDLSVASLERINRRPRSSKLVPGETLIVYAKRSPAAVATPADPRDQQPEPLPPLGAELSPVTPSAPAAPPVETAPSSVDGAPSPEAGAESAPSADVTE